MNQRLKLISLIWAICAGSCFAQVETLTAKRGEVFALESSLDGEVRWIVYHPLDLKHLTLFNKDLNPVLVFTPPANVKQVVIEEDAVHWDKKERTSKRWVVTFEGDQPEPEPEPDPDDPDDPEPTPPDDVEDGYLGITKLVASQSVGAKYRKYGPALSATFAEIADGLVPGDAQRKAEFATVTEAMEALRQENRKVLIDQDARTAWDPVLEAYDGRVKENLPLTKYQLADAMRAASKGFGVFR